ncbi:pyruvate dehydrogenase (acetyl-transferring), homodimeric type [Truepera radiovictrix]|uniref:Pyruvate dehydrogenase E1 component n=1 Tax=Truepera radiovictrix (strain DSM 17093 / CIP 108686 / LMG 22925 / RQ-24) TaxID=649638 RepID=D7CRX1_TRURR|nr:2-oxo-acid dehydrogenase E1 subunit, homodimeric type [Truepera radiovictrix DSM 17093]
MADTLEKTGLSPEEQRQLQEIELREWLESLEYVLDSSGPERALELLKKLEQHAKKLGVEIPFSANTPYINTIPAEEDETYPGDLGIEKRIRNLIRWNAMAMVVRANKLSDGIGGHISTYASAATLYEVGMNHFFRGEGAGLDADMIYFQGHASPGIYARSYLERRIHKEHLRNFRRELQGGPSLTSYPHAWLMPEYWTFATVSMGLGPIMSIYQARFNRYLEDRGLKEPGGGKVWAFLGDGETDEPETLGAISLAAREKLDNLIWVINCNLQRLDGPVRGNSKIIQELEASFRGTGWNVIKVVWGSGWDKLMQKDTQGVLLERFEKLVDGESQRYAAFGAPELRKNFFNTPELQKLIEGWSDEDLAKLNRGGHDPIKVYTAYKRAVEHKGQPTVILARTIKGYGLGESGEGKNVTHQQKKLNEDELKLFRDRFDIPISDDEIGQFPFYRPDEDTEEFRYLKARREALGGSVPARRVKAEPLAAPDEALFEEFGKGTGDREVSTTMVFVRILGKLLRDKTWGKLIVPIIPDEARTFGMEALFRQIGIYSHVGQLYEPVDSDNILYYKESTDGQILEEGITEAGSISSFIAAGTAYATHGVNTIPFFIYYSMFGFQRIGDFLWAAGDMRTKGFLLGATAGRTTLAGEGLQHQDGHSHVLAYPIPNLMAYDPSFAFEMAIIIREGMRRMYEAQEDLFYYLTIGNENYRQPALPEHLSFEELKEGVLKGLYLFKPAPKKAKLRAQLFGSGAIMNEVLKAQALLADYKVAADVWSVTSYKALHQDALRVERHNRLHPEQEPQTPFVYDALKEAEGVFVAASDYLKLLPDALARHLPRPMVSLGTDGFGRSEAREELRDHFEVDARFITLATLQALAQEGKVDKSVVAKALKDLEINPDKLDPHVA